MKREDLLIILELYLAFQQLRDELDDRVQELPVARAISALETKFRNVIGDINADTRT